MKTTGSRMSLQARRPPRTTSLALNLAPMVDVMMCLLIFFMLATKMVETEHSHVDLPKSEAALQVERQALGDRIAVNVTAGPAAGGAASSSDGQILYLVNNATLSTEELRDRLREEAKRNPKINCLIRADQAIAYQHVEDVLRCCADVGIANITFSALRAAPEGDM